MKEKSKKYVKLKLNKSAFDLAKARISTKFRNKENDEKIKILEKGVDSKYAYARLSNGLTFYDLTMKSLITNIFSRYHHSHYELITKPSKYAIHLSHIDNLLNLPISEEKKNFLKSKMPIKEGDIVLELGAFRGFGTIKLSELVGKDGLVIAVEASKENYNILQKNILSNNINNVKTINKGIWSKTGKSFLHKEKDQRTSLVSNLLKNKGSHEEINIDSVDHILTELKIDKVDFITMEINAAEVEALKGMTKTMSNKNIRIVSAGWYNYNGIPAWKSLKDILEKYDFQVFIGVQNRVFAIKE